jgi:hypothetical protein
MIFWIGYELNLRNIRANNMKIKVHSDWTRSTSPISSMTYKNINFDIRNLQLKINEFGIEHFIGCC